LRAWPSSKARAWRGLFEQALMRILLRSETFHQAFQDPSAVDPRSARMMQHAPPPFYVGERPPENAPPVCFLLVPGIWDDYTFRTQFELYVHRTGSRPVSVGEVKILPRGVATDQLGYFRTLQHLPPTFAALSPAQFCSLGQSSQYYSAIHRIHELLGYAVKPELVVEALADLCFVSTTDRWWEHESGFATSLLRYPAANVARQQATSLVRGVTPKAHNHNALLISDVADGPVDPKGYELNFDGTLEIPGRLNVVVGRNGSGKTTLLKRMASRLSGDRPAGSERKPPQFSRIAFVSNNVFDEGHLPLHRTDLRFIGPRPGDKKRIGNVVRCAKAATDEQWPEVLRELFADREQLLAMLPDTDDNLKDDLLQLQSVLGWEAFATQVFDDESLCRALQSNPAAAMVEMSAGQKALAVILAGMYRDLDQQGLVLLDEPENYLHPSLIARFVRHLNLLLDERKAFAIVATHSPIIVQETPSRFVTVMERSGDTIRLRRPPFETFGESVENIDEYLFETDFGSSHWKSVLSEFAQRGLTDSEICERLHSAELPLLAQSYLERQRLKHGT
jgi:predicted ATPase